MGIHDVKLALRRARFGIVSMTIASFIATALGVAMVHAGNASALRYRDLVIAERDSNSTAMALHQANRAVAAAAWDAGDNLVVGTVTLLAGYWPPAAYTIAIIRGWVLGLVSIDSRQVSRFSDPFEAMYYLMTLLLQQLAYVLVAGAGITLRLARGRRRSEYTDSTFLKVPREAWLDAARVYVLSLPLFVIAAAFEFLAPSR